MATQKTTGASDVKELKATIKGLKDDIKSDATVIKSFNKSMQSLEKRSENQQAALRRLVDEWAALPDEKKDKLKKLGKAVKAASALLGRNN